MGRVFEFPSQQVQGLTYLDRQLRRLLESRGADPPLIDFAATSLTQIYARFNEAEPHQVAVQFPETMNAGEQEDLRLQIYGELEGIRRENHAVVVKMMAQLVLAEVRLYQQQRIH